MIKTLSLLTVDLERPLSLVRTERRLRGPSLRSPVIAHNEMGEAIAALAHSPDTRRLVQRQMFERVD
jgi:hypothetical protein